jgi:DNA replication and repair protein RecF
MSLSSVSLRNIRKHAETQIDFSDNLNYIIGGNGVGKTTILEAIHYLSTTKSCVTSTDSEAVSFGMPSFAVDGHFTGRTEDEARITYSISDNKKQYLLNGKQINKFSEVIGKFPVVLLSPSDHSITQGYSSERRRFIDSVISQASKTYLNLLIDYNRTIKQRNFLLNRIREKSTNDSQELTAWNQKLFFSGVEIIKHRKAFTSDFEAYVKDSYKRILINKEEPTIKYSFLEGKGSEDYESDFYDLIKQRREEEIRRGTSLVGPHKDEFIFGINGITLRNYGSQGQSKTFQTVLRFAEFFYLKDKTGNPPLFLLDDVFGELDAERARSISGYLSSVGQAIITLTDFGNSDFLKKGKEDRVIKISDAGSITYA